METKDLHPISVEALCKTKQKKTKPSGSQGIATELLKYGGMLLKYRFLHFTNRCWLGSRIPQQWRMVIVVSILKKGGRYNTNNYIELSILNPEYKIYARTLKA